MIEVAPISENRMTYDEAVLYCAFCTHNGHRDWRLPTREEYLSRHYSIIINIMAMSPGWWDGDYCAHGAIDYLVQPVRDTTWYRYIICIIKILYDRISTSN